VLAKEELQQVSGVAAEGHNQCIVERFRGLGRAVTLGLQKQLIRLDEANHLVGKVFLENFSKSLRRIDHRNTCVHDQPLAA
jgi:hypothetical protein